MLDRQQVEQVLKKHDVTTGCLTTCCPGGTDYLVKLCDELCALSPAPSREALENILDRCYRNHGTDWLAYIADLMAWATGSPQRKWCKEIRWINASPTNVGWMWDESGKGAVFGDAIPDSWKFCPLCAAPRPQ